MRVLWRLAPLRTAVLDFDAFSVVQPHLQRQRHPHQSPSLYQAGRNNSCRTLLHSSKHYWKHLARRVAEKVKATFGAWSRPANLGDIVLRHDSWCYTLTPAATASAGRA